MKHYANHNSPLLFNIIKLYLNKLQHSAIFTMSYEHTIYMHKVYSHNFFKLIMETHSLIFHKKMYIGKLIFSHLFVFNITIVKV